MKAVICLFCILFFSCKTHFRLPFSASAKNPVSGTNFYRNAAGFNWQQRDSAAVKEILSGNLPLFLRLFIPVNIFLFDSASGERIVATCYVAPDYLSVGTNNDWARVCITPMAAQKIADSLQCFLPTRKLVDAIYGAADVKLEPIPMIAFRDSTPTMYEHHLLIERQRRGRSGLIAGIKKDVVISGRISRDAKANRVAIYGWHRLDGKPIQPLHTGHVNWYVDYSHGIRLIYRKIKVNGKWMDYTGVLSHPVYKALLCDEEWCDYTAYPY